MQIHFVWALFQCMGTYPFLSLGHSYISAREVTMYSRRRECPILLANVPIK